MRAPLIISLTLALAPLAGEAQVYSWKDADGRTHYGDRPPAEAQAGKRRLTTAPAADPDNALKPPAAQPAQPAAKKPAETPEQMREREENCNRSRLHLADLESGQMRFVRNADGERVAIDGGAREAELARARKSVAEWCQPPR
jgi:hypothetical protein